MALMLQRAPVKARAPEFQARVKDWQQRVSQAGTGFAVVPDNAGDRQPAALVNGETRSRRDAPTATESATPAASVSESTAAETVDQSSSHSLRMEQADDPRHRDRETSRPTETLARASSVGEEIKSHPAAATDSRTWKYESEAVAEFPESEVGPGELAVPQNTAASSDPYERFLSEAREALPGSQIEEDTGIEEPQEWIATDLGGVFYLINLGLFLGLYGDFTTPDEPGIQLSIWDFVALLARELVGAEIESDEVWPLLERLAQREEGDPIGSGFDEEEVLSFEFSVLNSDSEFSSSDQLKTQNPKLKTSPAVAAWIDRLMPYVRVRLRQALGLSEDEDPGPIVCRHHARVSVTPTHLDVYLSLVELPIAVRLSGLDRNPGWVPAAGKYIAFHFE
jgi:hypothetical protein